MEEKNIGMSPEEVKMAPPGPRASQLRQRDTEEVKTGPAIQPARGNMHVVFCVDDTAWALFKWLLWRRLENLDDFIQLVLRQQHN
jgi:hypothetical protein